MPVHVAAAYAGPVTVMSLVVETGRQIEDEMLDAGDCKREDFILQTKVVPFASTHGAALLAHSSHCGSERAYVGPGRWSRSQIRYFAQRRHMRSASSTIDCGLS